MEALICPSCGSPDIVKVDAKEYKCNNCGTKSQLSKNNKYLVMSGIPCPDCDSINEVSAKFCGNCGFKLIKYCDNCGTENTLDKKFCSNCGNNKFSMDGLKSVVLKPGLPTKYKKTEVIKLLKMEFGLGLFPAIDISERTSVIASGITISDAINLKQKFEKFGAIIEISDSSLPLDPKLKK